MNPEDTRGHSFDGIEEFDNRLPNWWLWSFYVTIIFSVIYWVHYHTLGTGDAPIEAYAKAQAEAARKLEEEAARNPVTNESLLELARNPAVVAAGREIFHETTKCALCHRLDGSSSHDGVGWGIGPNLTDAHWIYGDSPMDIYTTILKGRGPDPEIGSVGGMQAWEMYGTLFVQRVTAYVLSIKNTNVTAGKAPEKYAKKIK